MQPPSTVSKPPSRSRSLLAIAAGVLAASVGTAAFRADQAAAPGQAASKPQAGEAKAAAAQDDEAFARLGEEITGKLCNTACHGLEKLDEMRRTPREWNDSLTSMVTRGALGTEAQFETVRRYLKRYYGLVAVNTATAEELSAVLGFTSKDAQAIVDYRAAHGKFADAAALAKVPGIDTTKIDEQPDALRFS